MAGEAADGVGAGTARTLVPFPQFENAIVHDFSSHRRQQDKNAAIGLHELQYLSCNTVT
jgi:hypothetical protein